MKNVKLVSTFLLVFCFAMLTACGGSDNTVVTTTTTQGQELQDLKKSYDQGIITEKEYENAKEEILDRY
jgi:uncharacterized membrane protein